jgi:hypothetical protein
MRDVEITREAYYQMTFEKGTLLYGETDARPELLRTFLRLKIIFATEPEWQPDHARRHRKAT